MVKRPSAWRMLVNHRRIRSHGNIFVIGCRTVFEYRYRLALRRLAERGQVKIRKADSLPRIGEEANAGRVHRLSFDIFVVRRVMLRSRKMPQQPYILNALEEQECTPAALLSNKLHCALFASCAREKKGDDTVVERPVFLKLASLYELNRVEQMTCDLPKTFGAAIDLYPWNANRQRCLVRA